MSATEPLEILLLRATYAAFNSRDIDSALSTMRSDVAWPNGMEGDYIYGHAEIRAYWTRQWSTIDPRVALSFDYDSSGLILVDVTESSATFQALSSSISV